MDENVHFSYSIINIFFLYKAEYYYIVELLDKLFI